MKIIQSGDWHLGPGRFSSHEETTLNCINWMLERASSLSPDLILSTGDLFDRSKVWMEKGAEEVQKVSKSLKQLSKIAPVVVIKGTGNHDGIEHFNLLIELLSDYKNITFITKPETVRITTQSGVVNVIGIPAVSNRYNDEYHGLSKEEESMAISDTLMEVIKTKRLALPEDEPAILMGHYTVTGANTESSQLMLFSENEVVLPQYEIDELCFDLVAMGHIHRPQKVGESTFYAGAINALNFNDEGQDRGFYFHDLAEHKHELIVGPYQKYQTLRFTNEDIEMFNTYDYSRIPDVTGKIVRIFYEARQEIFNQFDKDSFKKTIENDFNATWVSEVTCERCFDAVVTTAMGSDPLENIKTYFKDNNDVDIDTLVKLAQPIMIETHKEVGPKGQVVPLELQVSNYRSYADETLDFSNIHFTTVDGPNGAGKSSLFMDAFMDCLFEQTREGDVKAWISNDVSVKSGSITLTFSVGSDIYRVVRTRSKKGRATLKLAQWIEESWVDCSKPSMRDTQTAITDLVGSPTILRSCALIMQDDYGVFLESNNKERMEVLADILGLTQYEKARETFVEMLQEYKRNLSVLKSKRDDVTNSIQAENDLESKIKENTEKIKLSTSILEKLELEKKNQELRKRKLLEVKQTEENLTGLQAQYSMIKSEEESLNTAIALLKSKLEKEDEIRLNAKKARDCAVRLNQFGVLEEKFHQLRKQHEQLSSIKPDVNLKSQIDEIETVLRTKDVLKLKSEAYLKKSEELDHVLVDIERKKEIQHQLSLKANEYDLKEKIFNDSYTKRLSDYGENVKMYELINNSGCKGSIDCPFIEQAKTIDLATLLQNNKDWKHEQSLLLSAINDEKNKLQQQLDSFKKYDVAALKSEISSLLPSYNSYQQIEFYEKQMIELNRRKNEEDAKIKLSQEQLVQITTEIQQIKEKLDKKELLKKEHDSLLMYIDLENSIEGDRREHEIKLGLLSKNLKQGDDLTNQIKLESELIKKIQNEISSIAVCEEDIVSRIEGEQELIRQLYAIEGQLKLRLDTKANNETLLLNIKNELDQLAKDLANVEYLKEACSYTGIPHCIITDEIKSIETKANAILSQMTNGKISVGFLPTKLTSKKEVPTLDVVIEETGKGALPYHSRSGGERVKVALATALALAELKASKTGVQLGFLFLDEPPYLDADGMEAYFDSLAAIGKRYSGLKVLAITHDLSMRSRFLETIQVVKDEKGSHILF